MKGKITANVPAGKGYNMEILAFVMAITALAIAAAALGVAVYSLSTRQE